MMRVIKDELANPGGYEDELVQIVNPVLHVGKTRCNYGKPLSRSATRCSENLQNVLVLVMLMLMLLL